VQAVGRWQRWSRRLKDAIGGWQLFGTAFLRFRKLDNVVRTIFEVKFDHDFF
jgi:hypothetical protein